MNKINDIPMNKEGQFHGYYIHYNEKTYAIQYRGNYLYDKAEGLWEFFYDNGANRLFGYYKNDIKVGFWKKYYSNNKPRYQNYYINF